jgi:hypothetical protein
MYLPDNLVKARHDDLIQAAARSRLAARTRRAHRPRRHRVIAAPIARLTLIRSRKATA